MKSLDGDFSVCFVNLQMLLKLLLDAVTQLNIAMLSSVTLYCQVTIYDCNVLMFSIVRVNIFLNPVLSKQHFREVSEGEKPESKGI